MDVSSQRKDTFLKHIAYLQIIGIILVVFGHSFHEYPDGRFGNTLLIYRLMSSFRMPLFMFVSGFLMVYTTRNRNKSLNDLGLFFSNKVRRLLLPLAFLTVVTFVPRVLLSSFADEEVKFSLGTLLRSLFYKDSLIIPFFWFLHASFILLTINYLALTLGSILKIRDWIVYSAVTLIFVVLVCLPWNFGQFLSLYKVKDFGIYFVFGAVYCRYSEYVDRYINWSSTKFFIMSAILWAVVFYYLEGTLYMPLCSIVGIIMCISFARILESNDIKILEPFIGANYMIFLLSWYFNIFSQQVLHSFMDMPWWFFTTISFVSGVYMPWLIYRFMKRHHADSGLVRVMAFLLGQSFKSPNKKLTEKESITSMA